MVLSMDRWMGKVAVVTGASSGIGAAIAQRLVSEGLVVVGLARRKERIDDLAKALADRKGKLYGLKVDVTQEQDILAAFKWIKDTLGPVHILVNNAGNARNVTLLDATTEDYKSILDTHVLGLCVATREAVKDMKTNKVDGHIIHMNSVAGHYIPLLPHLNMYGAAKHAITALTETLRQELNSIGSKIKVTSISPGVVDTDIFETSGVGPVRSFTQALLESEDVADATVYVLSTAPHVQVHELTLRPVGEKW